MKIKNAKIKGVVFPLGASNPGQGGGGENTPAAILTSFFSATNTEPLELTTSTAAVVDLGGVNTPVTEELDLGTF